MSDLARRKLLVKIFGRPDIAQSLKLLDSILMAPVVSGHSSNIIKQRAWGGVEYQKEVLARLKGRRSEGC